MRQCTDRGGGADEVGLFHVAAGEFVEVEAEPGQQRNAEHEVDLPGDRDDERGHAGDHQEAEFDPVARIQRHLRDGFASHPPRHVEADENDDGQPIPISSRLDPVMFAAAYCAYSELDPAVYA